MVPGNVLVSREAEQLDWILRQMCAAANIGLVGPQDHVISMGMYYGENRKA